MPLLFLCFTVSGCAFLPSTPKPLLTKTYTLPGSLHEVWRASLMTLISEYIPIQEHDESTGVIHTGEFEIQQHEYQKWTDQLLPSSRGYGVFQLRVVPYSETRTKIEIGAQFRGAKDGVIQSKGPYHKTTGVFEDHLAARIHTYVVLKKYPQVVQLVTGCNFHWNESIERYEVTGISEGSFGEEQGFQNGDIVVQMDGQDITMENFFDALTSIHQNEVKTFFIDRKGQGLLIEARIFFLREDLPWFGFHIERDLGTALFRVTEVQENSPAQKVGFQTGDILLQEEDVLLTSWHRYYEAMTQARQGVDRKFLMDRDGAQLWLTIHTEKPKHP